MNIKNNEQGVVAIVVSMFIIAIVTLVTVGFSRLMQREYKQATDRQFSVQATLAAESGINDVRQKLVSGLASTYLKDNCASNADFGGYDLAQEVKITCLRVDLTPPTLEFDSIKTDYATAVPIYPDGGVMSDMTISWSNVDDSDPTTPTYKAPSTANGVFPDQATWADATGMLRVDLVPTNAAGAANRDSLTNGMRTFYLFPSSGAAAAANMALPPAGYANQGSIVNASCNINMPVTTGRACAIRISGLAGSNRYYLRMQALYNNVAVTISAQNGGASVPFLGAQATVDSTGRNADVVKRVKVQLPINESQFPLDFGYKSPSNICKLVRSAPANSSDLCYSSGYYDSSVVGAAGDAAFTMRKNGANIEITNASNDNTYTGCSWSITTSNGVSPPMPAVNSNCALGSVFNIAGGAACVDAVVTLNMNYGALTKTYTGRNVKLGAAC